MAFKTVKRRWSSKYKKSIHCKKPRGFSQKQYCKYGRHNKKQMMTKKHKKHSRKNKKHSRKNKKGGKHDPTDILDENQIMTSSGEEYNNTSEIQGQSQSSSLQTNNGNGHISDEHIEYIIEYWMDAAKNSDWKMTLDDDVLNDMETYLKNVTYDSNYKSLLPNDKDPSLFTMEASEFDPIFNDQLNPQDYSHKYIALCNQANDHIEYTIFIAKDMNF